MTYQTNAHSTPADIGFDCAIHDPSLDRFPWQLSLTDGRVVLLSADLTRSVVLPAGGDIREIDGRHEVPEPLVPAEVLAAAKLALSQADGDALRAILRRRREIAHIWGVADVTTIRPDLTDDQAWEVLQEIQMTMDAETGINWQLVEDTAEDLFGPAPNGAGG